MQLGMVAGEASGDLLAAAVLQGIGQRAAPVIARGIGGRHMQATGFENWWSIDALSVRGYAEVLREYPRLRAMRNSLRQRMIDWRPDVFVGVDAPDFNLDLEVSLRQAGLKVAHFISPSIWAWRGERIKKIAQAVDHMLLVFPFEQALYERAGIPATYVGHPLADQIPVQVDRAAAREALRLTRVSGPLIALLPGSRPAEVHYMAPAFIETALWLARQRADLHFVIPAASEVLFKQLRQLVAAHAGTAPLQVDVTLGRSHEALAACDAVLVASGTASLEAALFKRPMVIAYRMAWLSYRLMRPMAYLPYVGLPNILCGRMVVPEFIQSEVTAQKMGPAMLGLLDSSAAARSMTAQFAQLHDQLRRDCAQRAAEVLVDLAGSK